MNTFLPARNPLRICLGLLLICLVSLPACAGKPTPTAAEPASLQTPELLDGVQLYQQHCSGCHGPLDQSEKLGRSVSRIHHAIHHFASMAHLKFLSIPQMKALSEALQQP